MCMSKWPRAREGMCVCFSCDIADRVVQVQVTVLWQPGLTTLNGCFTPFMQEVSFGGETGPSKPQRKKTMT